MKIVWTGPGSLLWGGKTVTQEELVARLQALGLDIDQSTLSRIENGERIVTDVEVLGVCQALGVGVAELFSGLKIPSE